ncbi:cytochrome b/b6 domain-containing protein [Variovorax saccharolyticus]|uniref:cytochrome b/b6 domain-containing protein n=1 Tax=Variovorax saccharolyticus TaxID=3053516 RepID=UPI0025749691|nr:cytochrome b/b6 domain-containing protein [Variovorax sp. J31P216]MDM0025597.1 cytochrome b/b6 domain-containing protein [Variovorax sp. J31P216]
MPQPGRADPTRGRTFVWDLAVRLHHWMLAALVVFCSVQDDGGRVHRIAGYAAAGLVVTRLLWALLARGHGGLAALKPSAAATLAYVRARAPRCIGHDPLGLWMVWLLWSLVILLGVTGWMSRLDAFWGDERLQEVHAWLADALLAAVALHLLGVGVMSWRWRENLPATMVTGRRRETTSSRSEAP